MKHQRGHFYLAFIPWLVGGVGCAFLGVGGLLVWWAVRELLK